ncbi:MAG: hypothetical protein LBV37_00260 [Mycoplasmataceae bacterium]|nr:hypothetical protein [Mycoplasmataceae bacterium]
MGRDKIQAKVAQMSKAEWDKCKSGERFNVDIITNTGKEPTTKEMLKMIIVRLDAVEARLDKQDILNETFIDYMHKHP